MKTRKNMLKGFTLVELLIVIALIAILSVAVLATINPIEQSNKARDAKFKNDAAEVMNAYERYYASQNKYPWNMGEQEASPFAVPDGTNGVAFYSMDSRFGVLPVTGSSEKSELIKTSELKGAFAGKEPFASNVNTDVGGADTMYIFHSTDSNYVCFCPKAKANKIGDVAKNLKCLSGAGAIDTSVAANAYTLKDASIDPANACSIPTSAEIEETTFCNLAKPYANLVCVPEGNVQ